MKEIYCPFHGIENQRIYKRRKINREDGIFYYLYIELAWYTPPYLTEKINILLDSASQKRGPGRLPSNLKKGMKNGPYVPPKRKNSV